MNRPGFSNIVMNDLDRKLEERNLGYCRWADDFVIVVRSERVDGVGDAKTGSVCDEP